jgi:hypothetical protein
VFATQFINTVNSSDGVRLVFADDLWVARAGIICTTFSFWLLVKLGMGFRQGQARLASWREILLAGSFESIINVAGTSYFYGFQIQSASVYFFGHLSGLLAAMAVSILCSRWLR